MNLLKASWRRSLAATVLLSVLGPVSGDAVAEDPLSDVAGWENEVEQLRNVIPQLRERLQRLGEGDAVVPLTLAATGVNDFEAATTFGLGLGSFMMSNGNTDLRESINLTDPIAGAQDLRLDFGYRNEAEPYQQWIAYFLNLTEGSVDMTNVTGIRLWAKADQARNLRLDLQSPTDSLSEEGIHHGWDAAVGPTATQIEVLFADAAIQWWAVDQGRDPQDPLSAVLASITGLGFRAEVVGVGDAGRLAQRLRFR